MLYSLTSLSYSAAVSLPTKLIISSYSGARSISSITISAFGSRAIFSLMRFLYAFRNAGASCSPRPCFAASFKRSERSFFDAARFILTSFSSMPLGGLPGPPGHQGLFPCMARRFSRCQRQIV